VGGLSNFLNMNQRRTYEDHQREQEARALQTLRVGQAQYVDPYRDAPLWIACHRLKNKGVVRESVVSNCFEIIHENQKA
jgi:hypothetical protein